MFPNMAARIPRRLAIPPNTPKAPFFTSHRHNSNNAAIRTPLTAFLECERKFTIAPLLRSRLQASHLIHGLHFSHTATETFQDRYFDFNNLLLNHGIWLRLRTTTDPFIAQSGTWEAKLRIGETDKNDYINSEFEEVVGEEEVYAAIKQRLPSFRLPSFNSMALRFLGNQELEVAISTEREVWMESGEKGDCAGLKIVLDKVSAAGPLSEIEEKFPFLHEVGEVEATATMRLSGDVREDEMIKRDALFRMDSMIEEFMVDEGLFPTQPTPVGKLSAYFEWKKMVAKEEMRLKIEKAKL